MPRYHRRLVVALTLLIAIVASVAVALASSARTIVKAGGNASLSKTIVVDVKGKTLYRLSGETSKTFKCTSSQCLTAWPPLTVTRKIRLKAGTGVHGKLTLVHRSGVKGFQVLLGGKPLYFFAGDTAAGDAKGEGLTSFGGTWNVLTASGTTTKTNPTTTTTSSSPAPMYPDGGGY